MALLHHHQDVVGKTVKVAVGMVVTVVSGEAVIGKVVDGKAVGGKADTDEDGKWHIFMKTQFAKG